MCKIKTRDYYHEIRLLQLSNDIIDNNKRIETNKYKIEQDYMFISINLFILCSMLFIAYNQSNIIALIIAFCVICFSCLSIYLAVFHILELNKLIKLLYENNRLSLKLKFLLWKSQEIKIEKIKDY